MQIRHVLLTALAVLLMVTSFGIAMARGAMAADGQLCASTGSATIVLAHDGLPLMDADGEFVVLDTSACLDCLIAALADAPMASPIDTVLGPFLTLDTLPHSDWIVAPAARLARARAPPLSGRPALS